MIKTAYFFILTTLLLLTSCTEPLTTTEETPIIEDNNKPALISKADWLIGTWEAKSGKDRMVETWAKVSETSYKGTGLFINDKDTVSTELLEIKENETGLYYCPTVANQNQGQTIEFKLTSSTDNSIVFENPAHDFPQKISYTLHEGDSITAEVSGMLGTEYQSQPFVLHRVK